MGSVRGQIRLRRWLCLLVSSAISISGWLATPRHLQETPPLAPEVDRLISQLADEDFQVRQAAESRLLELGMSAVPLLEQHQQAGDYELRLRVLRLVELIRQQRLESLVQGFLKGRNSLPGWEIFSRTVGDHEGSRELYAGLYRTRQSTLDRSDDSEDQVQLLKDLLKEFATQGSRRSGSDPALMTCLSLQVIKSLPGVSLDKDLPPIRHSLAIYFSHANFVEMAGESRPLSRLHREAAIRWINYPDPNIGELQRRITVALALALPEGLPAAVRCLETADAVPGPTIRDAMQLIARFGDDSQIPLVSRFLDETEVLHTARFLDADRKQTVYSVQVGDVALGTVIRLAGQSYQDFGMNLIDRSWEGQPLPTRYSGFATEEDRSAARAAWKRFQSPPLSPPGIDRK
jgi:hypothetical protein